MRDWCFGLSISQQWRTTKKYDITIILLFFEITLTFEKGG